MAQIEVSDLLSLPLEERVEMVRVLWESIVDSQESYPLSEAERAELDRRLAAYDRDPDAGSSWEEVERRITSQ